VAAPGRGVIDNQLQIDSTSDSERQRPREFPSFEGTAHMQLKSKRAERQFDVPIRKIYARGESASAKWFGLPGEHGGLKAMTGRKLGEFIGPALAMRAEVDARRAAQ
jgi:hypothetical protein